MKREYFNLARAIAAEESPCIPCVNWGECYGKKLACQAYNNYYETGLLMGNKEPTATIYKGIFNVGPRSA